MGDSAHATKPTAINRCLVSANAWALVQLAIRRAAAAVAGFGGASEGGVSHR
jgi:hypothetical protein